MIKNKGISTIIAIIMVLMITVALVALLYTWITTMTTGATTTGGEQLERTAELMQKPISLMASRCENVSTINIINFTIRNVGTKDIVPGELAVFIDEVDVSDSTDPVASSLELKTGEKKQINYQTNDQKPTRRLRIVGPTNVIEKRLTCE